MKFSHAVLMLALLSSSLFSRNKVVEAASTLNGDESTGQNDFSSESVRADDTPNDSFAPPVQDISDDKQPSSPHPSSASDEAPKPTPLHSSGPVESPTQPDSAIQLTQQEKTILSTILKSFKNGHVDLATLASALNDPNVSRLASSLSKANLTKLAEVLEEPHVDLSKLVSALSDPDLNLDKLVGTFGDPKVSPANLKPTHGESGIMSMMKNWASQIGESFKGHMTMNPSTGMTNNGIVEKHGIEAITHKPTEEQVSSDIPTGFERSTPSPDANTYGKTLMTGMEVPTLTTDNKITLTDVEAETAQSTFDHKLIYYAVAGVLGLSMLIFLATRLSKSGGEEIEETRSSVRMVV